MAVISLRRSVQGLLCRTTHRHPNFVGDLAHSGVSQASQWRFRFDQEFFFHNREIFALWSESIVKSFNDDADGCIPLGITKDAQDNIYGINTSCGLGLDYGTVWEVTNAGVYSRVHQFSATGEEGTYPSVGLTIDDAGNLYGATQAGGNQNLCSYEGCGVLYKMTLTANGWEETVLYQFSDEPGDAPNGDLTFDAKGNLFGTTVYNFNNNYGTLFELSQTPNGPVFNTIVVFGDIFGPPSAGVVFDSNGRAYGTQSYGRIGYGAVYEFAP